MRVLKYSVDVRPGPVSDVLAMVRSACLPGIEGFALPARAINLASARACLLSSRAVALKSVSKKGRAKV